MEVPVGKKRRRPLSGPSLCDARRRIPASLANQVAGTWFMRRTIQRDPQASKQPRSVATGS